MINERVGLFVCFVLFVCLFVFFWGGEGCLFVRLFVLVFGLCLFVCLLAFFHLFVF